MEKTGDAMQKVRLVEILDNELVTSDATQSWTYRELAPGETEEWGPYTASIRAHCRMTEADPDFE